MKKEEYGLLDALQYVDEQMIYDAGQSWNQKRKNRFAPAAVQAACVMIIVAAGLLVPFHKEVGAAINRMTTYLGEWLGNERDLLPYTEVLNTTQTDDGVSMTLKEVVMDSGRILVSVETAFEDKEKEKKFDQGDLWAYIGSVWINGEYIDSLSTSGSQTEDANRHVLEYSYEQGAIPEDMSEVKLLVYLAQWNENGMTEEAGKFTFTFTATKEQLQAGQTVLPLNVKVDMGEEGTMEVLDLSYTELAGRLRVRFSKDPRIWHEETFQGEKVRWYDIPYSIGIRDDQGNQMTYYPTGNYFDEEEKLTEVLFDSNGGTPPAKDAAYVEVQLYKPSEEPVKIDAEEFSGFPVPAGEEVRKELR